MKKQAGSHGVRDGIIRARSFPFRRLYPGKVPRS
jgi:hypothetical protein